MPRITIDDRTVEVPDGATILDAARRLGIAIPTLCHLDGCEPSTSCLVCVVRLAGRDRLVPSCATVVVDGMSVESETHEVHHARRMALELLLSDHLGDCFGPCQTACPVHMDIPLMLRQIEAGRSDEAIVTIRRDMALAAVLGRVCGRPCEKGCRRAALDQPVAICSLKAHVAEQDLASDSPYLPPCGPATGRRVAVVGAGPCALAAAYHLTLAGHQVTLFEREAQPGGRLRREFTSDILPPELVDAEIALLARLGVNLRLAAPIADRKSLDALLADHDAMLLACGDAAVQLAPSWKLAATTKGIDTNPVTFQTDVDRLFAAGRAVRGKGPVVLSVADGKNAAAAIDKWLKPGAAPGSSSSAIQRRPWTTHAGQLTQEELVQLVNLKDTPAGLSADAAEAARCLHCDCRRRDACRLKLYAEQYAARPGRYKGTPRKLTVVRAASGLIYEPGKCIDCGLCIQVASKHRDVLGLTFIGRGFNVRVGTPLDHTLDEALGRLAAECVEVCPTSALAFEKPR